MKKIKKIIKDECPYYKIGFAKRRGLCTHRDNRDYIRGTSNKRRAKRCCKDFCPFEYY